MKRVRMPRLMRENLPVQPLCLNEPPGIVVLDGQVEGLLDGHLGHLTSEYRELCGASQFKKGTSLEVADHRVSFPQIN